MSFEGKVALVTGGSQGIGEAVAKKLAGLGATVAVVASSDVTKAKAVAEAIGDGASAHVCDVRDAAACKELVEAATNTHGKLDVLVNCAGVFYDTPVGGGSDGASRMIDINLKGTWHMIDAAAPKMQNAGGVIVNFASVAGVMGLGTYGIYCATKAGIIMLTRALAPELGPQGIRVNCIAPGNTATPMNEAIRTEPEYREFLDVMAARTPSGQTYSDPDDMANIVAFLASDNARAIYGACILADEGFSAGM